jgi:protein-S-isoprenylcysteine O-methyltransferase Ste14
VSRARLLLSAAIVALLVGARLAWSPGLLGAPGGEVFGHAWVQWWHAEALPGWPAGPEGWLVDPRPWPVIDPLPTLLAAVLGRLGGLVTGWNALLLGGVVLAFVGGADLARRVGGDPTVGGLALALAPALMGSAASGLTEDLAIGLAAMALARVGDADWKQGALAGALLGVLAWCGLLLAWMAGVAALGLGVAALVRDRSRWRSLVAGAAIAGALAAPAALLQGSRLGGQGHRAGAFVERTEPLWRLNPWKGVDLASFVVPGAMDPGDALVRMHPGYLGLSLLGLALAGRWSRWWVVLGVAVLLAPGPRLAWTGSPLGLDNPAVQLLQALPFGELVNHHGRLLLLGAIALAALASRGAARVPPRWRMLIGGLVAMDLAALSPLPLPLPVAPHAPLPVYDCATGPCTDGLSDGGLLELPVAGPGIHFQRPLLQQPFHRRPVMADPNRPGLPPGVARTDSGRWLGSLAFPAPAPAAEPFVPPPGISVLVARDAETAARMAAVLGPPDIERDGSAAWDVAE